MKQSQGKAKPFALGFESSVLISLIICASMLFLGIRLNSYVRDVEIESASDAHAVFMTALIQPLLRDVTEGEELPPAITAELDHLLDPYIKAEGVTNVIVWWPDGTVGYSTDRQRVGSMAESDHLDEAFAGNIIAHLDSRPVVHGAWEVSNDDGSVLEVYVPLSPPGVDHVVAVGEFYQRPTLLLAQMRDVAYRIWAAIGLTTLLMLGLLFLAIGRARRILRGQQDELNRQLDESLALAAQNDHLRQVAEQAKLDAVEVNEDLLNRIGADLHDGPLQLLALAVLQRGDADDAMPASDPAAARAALTPAALTAQAMQELRHLAYGLTLPELDDLPVAAVLRLAVSRHENQTGTKVALELGELPEDLSDPVKISLYRVVQEGLNNAYRHAGGAGQKVSGSLDQGEIEIRVSDRGPGLSARTADGEATGLGLSGLARRLQALGGRLEVSDKGGRGTVVTARVPV